MIAARGGRRCLLLLALLGLIPAGAQDIERRRGFSVAITAPANQEIVFGRTRISAEVTIEDLSDVAYVEFKIGDETIFVDHEPPFETWYDFGNAPKSFVVRAIARHVDEITVSDAIVTRRTRFTQIERVNRVVMWINVTDREERPVIDLDREDFKLYEADSEQKIIDFYLEDRPIQLAIVLDSSGSMIDKIEEVHEAASSFVDTLRPEDSALIIDFDENVFLIQDLTSDHDELKSSLSSTTPLGATAMYDALHASYRKLEGLEGRKAIVLLTDGEDNTSQFSYKRVLDEAKANRTLIYTIGIGGGTGAPRKGVLKEFAEVTGGRAFFVKKASDLGEVYRKIAEELRTQFYMTYATDNEKWNGRWVPLKVTSKNPEHRIKARRGFFAVQGKGESE